MPPQRLHVSIIAAICCAANANAQAPAATAPLETGAREHWLHARVGVGLNPVVGDDSSLPTAHLGYGASLAAFVYLPYRISTGVGFDWERYTFDSNNFGDASGSPARYTDEALTHTRLMALMQWDILPRRVVTPYVLAGLGYGWEDAELTQWQCSPALSSGPVLGAGAGLDWAVHHFLDVGLEYRVNTLPQGSRSCTLAFISNEPLGPPADFTSQRVGLTLSVRY
jgi:opacity protein-like surface antigen